MTLEERRAWVQRRDPEKVRKADRARFYRDHDKRLERVKAWSANNVDKVRAAQSEWVNRNQDKRRAHNAVASAKRLGTLKPEPCEVCGTDDVHAHHDDYTKPLDVRWLCSLHHGETHRMAA